MKDNKNLDNLLKEAETSKKLDNLLSVLDSKEPLEESKKLPAAVYYAKYKKKQAEAQQAVAAEREAFLKARSQKKEEAKQDPNAGSIVEEDDSLKAVSVEIKIDDKEKDKNGKVELEPVIQAPESPEEYDEKIYGKDGDDTMKKENQNLKAIEESMKGIFSILRGGSLKEEELGSAAAEPVHDNGEAKELTPKVSNDEVYTADAHKQAEDVKEVVVENEEVPSVEVAPAMEAPVADVAVEETPSISISTDKVEITIPVSADHSVNTDSVTPEQEEQLAEAFAAVYKVFAKKPLNEEETVEVPENAEAEVEVEDGKLVITINVDQPETEVTADDQEKLDNAVEVIESVLVGDTDLGDKAATPVHDTAEAKEHTPELTNDDVLPADEHKQAEDVKEVVVENIAGNTDLGKEAATPVHDDSAEKVHTPDVDNADVFPADEHKQAEEVKEVVVENETPAIEIHTDSVEVTIPLAAGEEQAATEITPEQEEIVAEALAVIYKAFSRTPLNEEETVEVPENSEADVKVEDGKLVVTIHVDQPVAEISDEKGVEVANAVNALESVLVEDIAGDTDLGDKAATPVHDDSAEKEHTPDVENKDVFTDKDHKQAEDVKEVVVENVAGDTDLGKEAATPVHDAAEAKEHTPEVTNDDVLPADEHKQAEDVKEVVVENEIDPETAKKLAGISKELKDAGKVKKADTAEDIMNTEEKNKAQRLGNEASDVLAGEESVEETPETETPEATEEVEASEEVAEVEDDADAEVKVEDGKIVITIDADEVKTDLSDAQSAKLEEAIATIHSLLVKGSLLEQDNTEEVNDAGSDTINNDGDLEDPSREEPKKALPSDVTTAPAVATPAEKEPVKATPADVTEAVKYKSLKEAFLLENGYFDKDSVETVSAQAKRDRLLEQLALLTARDSKDPLYEELLQSTVVAKRIQKKLQEKYAGAATTRAEQMFALRQERKN
jgi:hypothetical protein